MLPRILQTEVMDSATEVRDYDAMDHAEVQARFVDDLLAATTLARVGAGKSEVLDTRTGTARIPIALCARAPDVGMMTIDLAEPTLGIPASAVTMTSDRHWPLIGVKP